ncbi:hypothetical protein SASPL_134590 [Salvia splendens]|uniref:F-box domain-containing protein n=2 Tax=Salvia splendens TaxID=180675 RepID=A0A8X8WX14_SALSN|nr:hypothetical protein SASPL_134590 [Salvia splendens]
MGNEDRISNLPSDLLISIISRLTIQRATTTSILSTRWRYLYCYITDLYFPSHIPYVVTESDYSRVVQHVLDSHRGSRIKEFRLCMSKGLYFERWFEFAVSKKAEIIHLSGKHDIDYEALFLRLPNTNNGFECLKDLYLHKSRMTEQDLKLLLSNCIALESLKLDFPFKLDNVSIVGHTKLKHLSLTCLVADSIVIQDAISLVSLKLYVLIDRFSMQLSNTPKLTQLYFEEHFPLKLFDELLTRMPACMRNQLQIMHLSAKVCCISEMHQKLSWVDLVNIKRLELNLYSMGRSPGPNFLRNFFRLVRLVEACSSLDKLVITFRHWLSSHSEDMLETYVGSRCELSPKYLKISQYSGAPSQLAFTLYLIDNARSLKKVSVVARDEEALACARHDFQHIAFVSFSVM